MPGLLRPGFGETLPAVLHRRFGVEPRTTRIAGAVAALAVAVIVVAVFLLARDTQYVHRGDPVFNLVYDDGKMKRVDAQPGEIVRLEGSRRQLFVAVSVLPLDLPAYRGYTGKGLLPLLAEDRLEELRTAHPDLQLRAEARSTVNDAPGYELSYRTGPRGDRTFWREILVAPDEDSPTRGVTLIFENRRPRRLGGEQRELVKAAKSAFRSFNFGTDRAHGR